MKYVVFVAPFVGSTMLRCLQAFLKLTNVRLGIITQQPYERLPKIVQNSLKDHYHEYSKHRSISLRWLTQLNLLKLLPLSPLMTRHQSPSAHQVHIGLLESPSHHQQPILIIKKNTHKYKCTKIISKAILTHHHNR